MPQEWIDSLVENKKDLAICHQTICRKCETSAISSALRLLRNLPKNIVCAISRNGLVEFSARTPGTLANALANGLAIEPNLFDYADDHWEAKYGKQVFHWWVLPSKIKVVAADDRTWKELLDDIVDGFGMSASDAKDLKATINGVVAYANGVAKRNIAEYSVDSIVSSSLQRFKSKAELKNFVGHIDFKLFLLRKAEELFSR